MKIVNNKSEYCRDFSSEGYEPPKEEGLLSGCFTGMLRLAFLAAVGYALFSFLGSLSASTLLIIVIVILILK